MRDLSVIARDPGASAGMTNQGVTSPCETPAIVLFHDRIGCLQRLVVAKILVSQAITSLGMLLALHSGWGLRGNASGCFI